MFVILFVLLYTECNGPFQSYPKPLFQSEAKWYEMIINSHANETLWQETFCTLPRFESEGFWNSKMAY